MPLDKLVLMIVAVMAAVAVTAWLAGLAIAAWQVPFAWIALIPASVAGYVVWRVVADRLGSAEDDHYDHIEK